MASRVSLNFVGRALLPVALQTGLSARDAALHIATGRNARPTGLQSFPRLFVIAWMLTWVVLTAPRCSAQDEKAEKKPGPNIIKNILQGFFPGPPAVPAPAPDPNGPGGGRDRLDVRAASDVELNRRVVQLNTLIRGKRWDDAVDLTEFLLSADEDHLYRLSDGRWVSLLAEVERIVLTMPEDGLRNYRNRFEGPAGQSRTAAKERGDLTALVQVASRHLATDSGLLAANDLATVLQDQGEYAAAARWYRRIRDLKPPFAQAGEWKVSAARCFVMAGDRGAAEATLKDVEDVAPFLQANADPKTLSPKEWLDSLAPIPKTETPLVRETRQPYGPPSHVAAYAVDPPLLFSRWTQPLVQRYAVEQQLQAILDDLVDGKKAPIPAGFPVVTAGNVAVRTLAGVAVFDAETGAEAWRIDGDAAPERLLAGEPLRRSQNRTALQNFVSPAYDGNNPEQHPLAGILFRDGVYGSLSSDGRRLFVLEEIAVMPQNIYGYWQQEDVTDPLGRDWKSNSLSAYDLQTGRRLWRIGGRKIEEAFSQQLAGTFFFGAPVVDGDDLFVIGEQSDSMHLFCIRPETGEVVWSQQISGVGQTIERDMVRRGWACFPAVSKGVIVCPTTSGWLVAIDRIQRRFLWTHRYLARTNNQNGRSGYLINQSLELHARWGPSAPIIFEDTVVFAPPELPDESGAQQPVLLGLDLATGKPKWPSIAKGEALIVGGAADGRVFLTGVRSLTCIDAVNGKTAWQKNWPDGDDIPSGRPLLTAKAVLQPMQSGALVEFDRSSGEIRRVQKLPAGEPSLGSLVVGGDRIYSVGPQELVSWEPDQPLEEFEKDAEKTPEGGLRLAELYLRLQRFEESVKAARAAQVDPGQQPELARRRHDVLWQGLWRLATSDLKEQNEAATELAAIAGSEVEQQALLRLQADRAVAQGKLAEAWTSYLKLIKVSGDETVQDGAVFVRQDAWLGGRLEEAYSKLTGDERNRADQDVERTLAGATDVASALVKLQLFSFHPASAPVQLKIADQVRQSGDLTTAAVLLRRLAYRPDQATRATALWQLGSLYQQAGWIADARSQFQRLQREYADVEIPVGPAGQRAAEILSTLPADQEQQAPGWTGPYEVVRVYREQSQQPRSNVPLGELPAFLDNNRLQVSLQTQRLSLYGPASNVLWSVPLRSSPNELYSQETPIVVRGPLTYVVHNGVVHSYSLLQQKAMWAHVPDLRGGGRNFWRQPQVVQQPPMMRANQFQQPRSLARTSHATGMLGTVSDFAVVVHEKRSLLGLDPLTGAKLWERRGVMPNAMVHTDGEQIYLYSGSEPPQVLDAKSGRLRFLAPQGHPLEKARKIVSGGVVQCEFEGLEQARRFVVKKSPPPDATGKMEPIEWKKEFAPESMVSLVGDSDLFVVEPEGDCWLLSMASGELKRLANITDQFGKDETLKKRSMLPMYCISDRDRLYLLVDRQTISQYTYLPLPNIRCAGVCIALSRIEPKVLWKQDVAGFNLPTDRLADMPVLPFVVIQNVNKTDLHYQQVKLRLLDKETGKPVVDWEGKSFQSHFYTIVLDLAHRALEFRSYNETFWVRPKLGAAEGKPASEPAAAPPPPTVEPEPKS
jgi:outer membrane protein assembly factor BamB